MILKTLCGVVGVFMYCTQLSASQPDFYEYFDSTALKYQFQKSYMFFKAGEVSRSIKECNVEDCIWVDQTILFKPKKSNLTQQQTFFEVEGLSAFIKPIKFRILSQEIDAHSITIETLEEGSSTFIYNDKRGVLAFELLIKSTNYKTNKPFVSSYFLVLADEKGIFSE